MVSFLSCCVHLFDVSLNVLDGAVVDHQQRLGKSRQSFQFKRHDHAFRADSGGETRRVIDPSEPCVAVGSLECLVEEHQTVVSIKHEITTLNRAGTDGIPGKARGQVVVLLVAVQLSHIQSQLQQRLDLVHGWIVFEPMVIVIVSLTGALVT